MALISDDTDRPIGARISIGAATLGGSMVATRIFSLITIGTLGRLLTPEDFGVVALATLVTGAVSALLGRHFEIALIRTPNADPTHIGSAFALSILWGSAAALMVLLLAEPVASILDTPEVAPVLRWLALVPLLDGLRNPGLSLYERDLRFGLSAFREIAARFSVLVVSLSLALLWRNYWAMVAGLIAYSATRMIFSHVAAPSARPRLSHWRDFLGFSAWMTGAGVATHLNRRIDRAFVGAELGVADAGRYRMGDELATLATSEIAWPLLRVLYPGLVKRSGDVETLRRVYNKAQGLMLALLMPAGVGVALVAEDFLRVVVGSQWIGAVPVIQVLAPLFALGGLTAGVHSLIFIQGETRTLFIRDSLMLLCLVPALWLGVELGGFAGLLAARGVSLVIVTIVTLNIAARAIGQRWWTPVIAGWRTFGACAAMAAVVLALHPLLPVGDDFLVAAARMAAASLAGSLAYFAAHWALWRLAGAPNGSERDALALLDKALRAGLRRLWRSRAPSDGGRPV